MTEERESKKRCNSASLAPPVRISENNRDWEEVSTEDAVIVVEESTDVLKLVEGLGVDSNG